MDTKLIKNRLDDLINDYAKDAYDVVMTEDSKSSVWTIILKAIKLEFIYYKKSKFTIPVSTLACGIYLEKNGSHPYTIQQVIDYLGINDFHSYTFAYIESEKRATACFNTITEFIDKNLNAIEELATSDFNYRAKRDEEIRRVTKTNNNEPINDFTYNFIYENQICRYTDFFGYKHFLKYKYSNSLKQYNKLKRKNTLYSYEEKLVDYIENLASTGEIFEPISDECNSILIAEKHNGTSKKDALAFILSIFIAYLVFLIPFGALSCYLTWHFNAQTIFGVDMAELLFTVLLVPFLPSFFAGIGNVDKISLMLHKNKEEVKDFSNLLNPKGTKIFALVLTILMVIASTFFSVMMTVPSVKCYEDYMVCDVSDSDFIFDYEEYKYSDIKEIYKVNAVYNEYTDKIMDNETYIIRFDNYDFYTSTSYDTDKVEEILIPQVQKYYKGEIRQAETDLDFK